MDMSISESDAVAAIDKLKTRIDSYVEESDYYYDSNLKNELLMTSYHLTANEDGEIQKTIDTLKMLIGEEVPDQ